MVSFTSSQEKDGKVHSLEIICQGEKANIGYQSPKANWFIENILWVSIGGFLFLSLLTYWFFYSKKQKEKDKQLQTEKINQLKEEQHKKNIEAQEKIKQQEIQMQLIKDKELAEQKKKLEEQRQKEKDAHLDKMKKQMLRSGNLPVLHFSMGEQHGSMTIEDPILTIGRDKQNNLHINHQCVSRNHLELSFDGESFQVKDLDSSNGTALNGDKIKKSEIRDGDVIQIGEIKIVFSK